MLSVVLIQGRLNGMDIAIQISQMGIINIQSLFSRGPNIFPWGIPH